MEKNFVYAVINNIPCDYHSSDLRNYFSQFIETRGFECFHFRHRPELQKSNQLKDGISSVSEVDSSEKHKEERKTSCCVVRVTESKFPELVRMYHRKHWLDRKWGIIPSFCYISRIQTADNESELQSFSLDAEKLGVSPEGGSRIPNYKTKAEQKKIPQNRELFTRSDLHKLPELHPPDIMPNGNVGTPTMVFMEFIKQCRLPPAVIKKLGLTFPRMRSNKKYGNVPFDYGGEVQEGNTEEEEEVLSGSGCVIPKQGPSKDEQESAGVQHSAGCHTEDKPDGEKEKDSTKYRWRKKSKMDTEARRRMKMNIEEKMIHNNNSGSGEDNDSCEEWERHEALYDDPSNQERNKERLFEEKIELKWEKGGSGLVFYTDAQYWQAQEGDFDEQTADDWDVDMSGYYEDVAGDKDARDYITMRQEQRRRDGVEPTDRYTCGITREKRKEPTAEGSERIGKFEQHSKGVGRKIMEKQGWSEGEGLGSTVRGMSDALESEGQNPKDRSGFGYRGEKLVRCGVKNPRRADKDVIISTKYDNPAETDPLEPLLRRHEHCHITYRHKVDFLPANDSTE